MKIIWTRRLAVRPGGFHPSNGGSTPLGSAYIKRHTDNSFPSNRFLISIILWDIGKMVHTGDCHSPERESDSRISREVIQSRSTRDVSKLKNPFKKMVSGLCNRLEKVPHDLRFECRKVNLAK